MAPSRQFARRCSGQYARACTEGRISPELPQVNNDNVENNTTRSRILRGSGWYRSNKGRGSNAELVDSDDEDIRKQTIPRLTTGLTITSGVDGAISDVTDHILGVVKQKLSNVNRNNAKSKSDDFIVEHGTEAFISSHYDTLGEFKYEGDDYNISLVNKGIQEHLNKHPEVRSFYDRLLPDTRTNNYSKKNSKQSEENAYRNKAVEGQEHINKIMTPIYDKKKDLFKRSHDQLSSSAAVKAASIKTRSKALNRTTTTRSVRREKTKPIHICFHDPNITTNKSKTSKGRNAGCLSIMGIIPQQLAYTKSATNNYVITDNPSKYFKLTCLAPPHPTQTNDFAQPGVYVPVTATHDMNFHYINWIRASHVAKGYQVSLYRPMILPCLKSTLLTNNKSLYSLFDNVPSPVYVTPFSLRTSMPLPECIPDVPLTEKGSLIDTTYLAERDTRLLLGHNAISQSARYNFVMTPMKNSSGTPIPGNFKDHLNSISLTYTVDTSDLTRTAARVLIHHQGLFEQLEKHNIMSDELARSKSGNVSLTDNLKNMATRLLLTDSEHLERAVRLQSMTHDFLSLIQTGHSVHRVFKEMLLVRKNVSIIASQVNRNINMTKNIGLIEDKILFNENIMTLVGEYDINTPFFQYSAREIMSRLHTSKDTAAMLLWVEVTRPFSSFTKKVDIGNEKLFVNTTYLKREEAEGGRHQSAREFFKTVSDVQNHPLLLTLLGILESKKACNISDKGVRTFLVKQSVQCLSDLISMSDQETTTLIFQYLSVLTRDMCTIKHTIEISKELYLHGDEIIYFYTTNRPGSITDTNNTKCCISSTEYLFSVLNSMSTLNASKVFSNLSASASVSAHGELIEFENTSNNDIELVKEIRDSALERVNKISTYLDNIADDICFVNQLGGPATSEFWKKISTLMTTVCSFGLVYSDVVCDDGDSLKFRPRTNIMKVKGKMVNLDTSSHDLDKVGKKAVQFRDTYNYMRKFHSLLYKKFWSEVDDTYRLLCPSSQEALSLPLISVYRNKIDNIWEKLLDLCCSSFELNQLRHGRDDIIPTHVARQILNTKADDLTSLQLEKVSIVHRPQPLIVDHIIHLSRDDNDETCIDDALKDNVNFIVFTTTKSSIPNRQLRRTTALYQTVDRSLKAELNSVVCQSSKLKQVIPLVHCVFKTHVEQLTSMVATKGFNTMLNCAHDGIGTLHLHNVFMSQETIEGNKGLISNAGLVEIKTRITDYIRYLCNDYRLRFTTIGALHDLIVKHCDPRLSDIEKVTSCLYRPVKRSLELFKTNLTHRMVLKGLDINDPLKHDLFGVSVLSHHKNEIIQSIRELPIDLLECLAPTFDLTGPKLQYNNLYEHQLTSNFKDHMNLLHVIDKLQTCNYILKNITERRRMNFEQIIDFTNLSLPTPHYDIMACCATTKLHLLIEPKQDLALGNIIKTRKISNHWNDLALKANQFRLAQHETNMFVFDFERFNRDNKLFSYEDKINALSDIHTNIDRINRGEPVDTFENKYLAYLRYLTFGEFRDGVKIHQMDNSARVKDTVSEALAVVKGLYSDRLGTVTHNLRHQTRPHHKHSLFHISGGTYKEREPKVRIFIRQTDAVRAFQPDLVNAAQRVCDKDHKIRAGQTDSEQTINDEVWTSYDEVVLKTLDIVAFCYSQPGYLTKHLCESMGAITGLGHAFTNMEEFIRGDGLAISDRDYVSSLSSNSRYALYYARYIFGSHQGMNQEIWSYRTAAPIILASSICRIKTDFAIKGDNINTKGSHDKVVDWNAEFTHMDLIGLHMAAAGMELSPKETIVAQGALNNCQRTTLLGLQLNTQLKGSLNTILDEKVGVITYNDAVCDIFPAITDAGDNNTYILGTPLMKAICLVKLAFHPKYSSVFRTYGKDIIDQLQEVLANKKINVIPSIINDDCIMTDGRSPICTAIVNSIATLLDDANVPYAIKRFITQTIKEPSSPEELRVMMSDIDVIRFKSRYPSPTADVKSVAKRLDQLNIYKKIRSGNTKPTHPLSGIPPNPKADADGVAFTEEYIKLLEATNPKVYHQHVINWFNNLFIDEKYYTGPLTLFKIFEMASVSNINDKITHKNASIMNSNPLGNQQIYGITKENRDAWQLESPYLKELLGMNGDTMGGLFEDHMLDMTTPVEKENNTDGLYSHDYELFDDDMAMNDDAVSDFINSNRNTLTKASFLRALSKIRIETDNTEYFCVAKYTSTISLHSTQRDVCTYFDNQSYPNIIKSEFLGKFNEKYPDHPEISYFSQIASTAYRIMFRTICTDKVMIDPREAMYICIAPRTKLSDTSKEKFLCWSLSLRDESINTSRKVANAVIDRISHKGPGETDNFVTKNLKLETIRATSSSITDPIITSVLLGLKVFLAHENVTADVAGAMMGNPEVTQAFKDELLHYCTEEEIEDHMVHIHNEIATQSTGSVNSLSHRLLTGRDDDVRKSRTRMFACSHFKLNNISSITKEDNLSQSEVHTVIKTQMGTRMLRLLGIGWKYGLKQLHIMFDPAAATDVLDNISSLDMSGPKVKPTPLPRTLISQIRVVIRKAIQTHKPTKWVKRLNDTPDLDYKIMAVTALSFNILYRRASITTQIHGTDASITKCNTILHWNIKNQMMDPHMTLVCALIMLLKDDIRSSSLLHSIAIAPGLIYSDDINDRINWSISNTRDKDSFKPILVSLAILNKTGIFSHEKSIFYNSSSIKVYTDRPNDILNMILENWSTSLGVVVKRFKDDNIPEAERHFISSSFPDNLTRSFFNILLYRTKTDQHLELSPTSSLFFDTDKIHKHVPTSLSLPDQQVKKVVLGKPAKTTLSRLRNLHNLKQFNPTKIKFNRHSYYNVQSLKFKCKSIPRWVEFSSHQESLPGPTLYMMIGDTLGGVVSIIKHRITNGKDRAIIIAPTVDSVQTSEVNRSGCQVCHATDCLSHFVINRDGHNGGSLPFDNGLQADLWEYIAAFAVNNNFANVIIYNDANCTKTFDDIVLLQKLINDVPLIKSKSPKIKNVQLHSRFTVYNSWAEDEYNKITLSQDEPLSLILPHINAELYSTTINPSNALSGQVNGIISITSENTKALKTSRVPVLQLCSILAAESAKSPPMIAKALRVLTIDTGILPTILRDGKYNAESEVTLGTLSMRYNSVITRNMLMAAANIAGGNTQGLSRNASTQLWKMLNRMIGEVVTHIRNNEPSHVDSYKKILKENARGYKMNLSKLPKGNYSIVQGKYFEGLFPARFHENFVKHNFMAMRWSEFSEVDCDNVRLRNAPPDFFTMITEAANELPKFSSIVKRNTFAMHSILTLAFITNIKSNGGK